MFNVFAYKTCVISGSEIKYELRKHGNGHCFYYCENDKPDLYTFSNGANRFECLDKFKHIYQELKPRFVLI